MKWGSYGPGRLCFACRGSFSARNTLKSICRKSFSIVLATQKKMQTTLYIYIRPGGSSEDFQLLRDQLDQIRNKHKGNKLPSVHVLGDFNFKDIACPDRLNKSVSILSQSEGQMLIDIMNDHGLEQLVHFPTREKNTLDLILTSLPDQFQEIHSPDKLSDHDQDQDQDSLLVKRRNDNHSPGPVIRELVPSSHQRSELSNTILCIFSG